MLFQHVSIASVAHVDAPVRLTSAEIMERLQPTRAKPRAEVEISGMVAHTVIVGPQGPEPEARPLNTYDVLPEPPQADEDD